LTDLAVHSATGGGVEKATIKELQSCVKLLGKILGSAAAIGKGSYCRECVLVAHELLLSGQMRAEQIGALVVSRDGNSIEGIVSERDLAYGLATYGGRLPTIPISELMTKAVAVCSPEDSVTDVMKLMTMRRIRHVPVKDGDQLVGIISIGDVLKHRLGELEVEAAVLRDYAVAARH